MPVRHQTLTAQSTTNPRAATVHSRILPVKSAAARGSCSTDMKESLVWSPRNERPRTEARRLRFAGFYVPLKQYRSLPRRSPQTISWLVQNTQTKQLPRTLVTMWAPHKAGQKGWVSCIIFSRILLCVQNGPSRKLTGKFFQMHNFYDGQHYKTQPRTWLLQWMLCAWQTMTAWRKILNNFLQTNSTVCWVLLAYLLQTTTLKLSVTSNRTRSRLSCPCRSGTTPVGLDLLPASTVDRETHATVQWSVPTPSSSIWPHLSYGLVRSKREYYHNCSLVVFLCSFL